MSKKSGGSVPSTAGVQVDSTENLRKWLTSVLKPLCDADPAALAKYVLALIKKDKPEKELRQSIIDQLDVFLQQETKGFVDLLFETLNSKKYMSHIDLSDDTQLAMNSENEDELQLTVNSTLPSGLNNTSTAESNPVSSSQSVHTPPAPTQETITPIVNTIKSEDSRVSSRRERKDDDKDRNKRKSRSPRRSRSRSPRERSRRSRSPRDRDRDRNRHRGRKLSPPIRRYERDIWDRRRSRSPARNRSASPRTRSRTPPRYRRPYHSRSRSKSRSRSQNRNRSRSPIREKMEKKDPLLPIPAVEDEPPKEADKPMIPSVVVRPGVNDQSEKVGYATALQSTPMNIGNRCRDFDERGLCMRGELCPYDHGQDPLVLEDIIVPPHIQRQAQEFGQSLGNQPIFAGPPQIIRPSVPLMDFVRGGPLDIVASRNELMRFLKTGEYYPDNPAVEPGLGWSTGQPPFRPRHMGPRGRPGILPRPMGPFPMPHQRELISVPVMGGPTTNHMVLDMRGPHQMHQPLVRGIHTTRGRGRGGFDHGRLGMKPTRNFANCSLEVKKVPREKNNIMDLNSHFLRFGKIVNIQINFENDPEAALITFSSPMEAQSAYRCTEAVLNNRFIRVFWHNKEKENEDGVDGDTARVPLKDRLGGVEEPEKLDQEKVLVSGSNLTKTVYNPSLLKKAEVAQDKVQAVEAIKKSQEMLAAQESRKRMQEERKKEAFKLMGDLRKRKQDMMGEQIEQQKKLISKLETNKSTMKPDEREKLMSLIKSLQESIETIKKDLEESSKVQILSQTATKNKEELIQTQREILDAELDLYNKEQEGGDTVALQKKVTELRVQAQSMGIIPRGRGSFRGASRGFVSRGRVIRGRGRMRSLRTVDRRPTKILITGFPPARLTDLLTHFAQFGPIEFYETDMNIPSMTISYGSRVTAEIAKGNGKTFGDVTLGIQWVANDIVDNSDKPNINIPSNGEVSHSEENDNAGSIEDDELGDILANEILLQYDEEDDDEDERSWRR